MATSSADAALTDIKAAKEKQNHEGAQDDRFDSSHVDATFVCFDGLAISGSGGHVS